MTEMPEQKTHLVSNFNSRAENPHLLKMGIEVVYIGIYNKVYHPRYFIRILALPLSLSLVILFSRI